MFCFQANVTPPMETSEDNSKNASTVTPEKEIQNCIGIKLPIQYSTEYILNK